MELTSWLLLWGGVSLWVMGMRVRADAMVPQTCSTQARQSCQAMIGYVPKSNYNLSEIASLFSLNYTSLLGPNDVDPSLPTLSQVVLPANKPSSIPQTCGCVNGKRVVTSTNYTVVHGNTLSFISDTLYSSLVTYQEIAAANGISSHPDLILPGQRFTIPIPCACFNQTPSTISLSYQIQEGDSLSQIAAAHNTSEALLQSLNSLSSAAITASSVLFIPLSVCNANFSQGALDKDLIVVEGKYELTANGCVLCNCANGTLHCIRAPSSLGRSCSNTTCSSSSLTLGSSTTSQGNGNCTIRSCVYKGYTTQSGILTMLETKQDLSCPVALPPEMFYKPPPDLVASPLPTQTVVSPSQPSTPVVANPPTSTTTTPHPTPTPTMTNPSSANMLFVGISSWWWWSLLLPNILL